MKSTKLLIVLVAIMALTFIATANADYRTLRQDRPVIVLEDHPWGGEIEGGGGTPSLNKVIIPELIGTAFGSLNSLRITIIIINEVENNDNGLLPDDFGDDGGNNHNNGQRGN